MTTSSANNSVFRGFFEKQKLTGPNFIDWYRQLRIVLSIDDKLNYLEQPLPPAPVAPAGQHVAPEILAAHTAWVKGSKEIAGLMLMTMEPEIQRNLENLHANDMLKELKALFAQQAEQELLQTTRDFHACKQEEGQSVSSYVLRMKGYIDNLERLGHPVTLGLAVSLILIGLRKEFDRFVQNYNMHSLGKTVTSCIYAKRHEANLNLLKQRSCSTMLFEACTNYYLDMYCDNTGATAIANESGITKGARHFRAKVHYLREVIKFGDIKLEKVHTDDNLADPFTKALAFPKHSELTRNIGMLPASSFM
ncbi:hypothetical protein Tco_0977139 [Tanacetum coccineum]|uniref:Zinc finger, CCHC-type n=1 Tax=Tanacetum coccineum TaxID=301880 RepID=A0ABQ5EKC7_9ASTR